MCSRPFSRFVTAFLLLFSSGANAGKIKIRAQAGNGDPAVGIRVDCYDYDPGNSDDYMGGGNLDATGYLEINYKKTSTSWWSCGSWWDACLNTKPDIYCELVEPGDCFQPKTTSTKNSQNQDGTTDFGTITLTADEAYCNPDPEWNGCGPSFFPIWLVEVANDVSGFQAQCNVHDFCYEDCTKTQSQCDDEFKDDMYDECNGNFYCEILADLFYAAVIAGGGSAYGC